jgi:hypothetical protein
MFQGKFTVSQGKGRHLPLGLTSIRSGTTGLGSLMVFDLAVRFVLVVAVTVVSPGRFSFHYKVSSMINLVVVAGFVLEGYRCDSWE